MRISLSRVHRLRMKWLWLRHTFWFQWAHKPLCDRFHTETFLLGRLHVCRSCTLLYGGMVLGFVGAYLLCGVKTPVWPALAVLAAVTVSLSLPVLYRRWPRGMRDVLRFAAGLIPGLCGLTAWQGNVAVASVAALTMCVFWIVYIRLRGGRRSGMCDGCPELHAAGICSGYAKQAISIRDYEHAATQLVMLTVRPQGEQTR